MVTVTILRWGYKPNYKYISCFFTVAGHQWMGPVVEPFQSRTLHMILSSNFGTCDQHWSKHFLHHWKRINLKSQIQKKSRCLSSWATQIPHGALSIPCLFERETRNGAKWGRHNRPRPPLWRPPRARSRAAWNEPWKMETLGNLWESVEWNKTVKETVKWCDDTPKSIEVSFEEMTWFRKNFGSWSPWINWWMAKETK